MSKMYEDDNKKLFRSPELNFNFDKRNGYTETWGKTYEDNPDFSPYGPMILDIEVTDICKGPGGVVCPFCYKSNNPNNTGNMSIEMFKNIIDKLPKYNGIHFTNQMAFGVDAQCESNPDIWKMMEYSRENGIIPNITIADISDEVADKLVKHCGAVACSVYSNKEYGYNSIKKLVDRGMKQCNIHKLVSLETLDEIYEIFNDYLNGEERLNGLNAIVLLSLKQKGRGKHFNRLPQKEYSEMVNFALDNNIPIGFDSCGQVAFINSVRHRPNFKELEMLSEPCESSKFSQYINCKSEFYPCSFSENQGEWVSGINVEKCDDFLKNIWHHPKNIKFRNKGNECLKRGIPCQIYNVTH